MPRFLAVLLVTSLLPVSCARSRTISLETELRSAQEELYQVQALLHHQKGRVEALEQRLQGLLPEEKPASRENVQKVGREELEAAFRQSDWKRLVEVTTTSLGVLEGWPDEHHLYYGARGLEEMGLLGQAKRNYLLLGVLYPHGQHAPEALWRSAALCRATGELDCERLVLHNLRRTYPDSRWEKEVSRRLAALGKANRR